MVSIVLVTFAVSFLQNSPMAEDVTVMVAPGDSILIPYAATDPDGDLFGFFRTSDLSNPAAGFILDSCVCVGTYAGVLCSCTTFFIASDDFSGSATFTYRAVDATGIESTDATVTLKSTTLEQTPKQILHEMQLIIERGTLPGGDIAPQLRSPLIGKIEALRLSYSLPGGRARSATGQARALCKHIEVLLGNGIEGEAAVALPDLCARLLDAVSRIPDAFADEIFENLFFSGVLVPGEVSWPAETDCPECDYDSFNITDRQAFLDAIQEKKELAEGPVYKTELEVAGRKVMIFIGTDGVPSAPVGFVGPRGGDGTDIEVPNVGDDVDVIAVGGSGGNGGMAPPGGVGRRGGDGGSVTLEVGKRCVVFAFGGNGGHGGQGGSGKLPGSGGVGGLGGSVAITASECSFLQTSAGVGGAGGKGGFGGGGGTGGRGGTGGGVDLKGDCYITIGFPPNTSMAGAGGTGGVGGDGKDFGTQGPGGDGGDGGGITVAPGTTPLRITDDAPAPPGEGGVGDPLGSDGNDGTVDVP